MLHVESKERPLACRQYFSNVNRAHVSCRIFIALSNVRVNGPTPVCKVHTIMRIVGCYGHGLHSKRSH